MTVQDSTVSGRHQLRPSARPSGAYRPRAMARNKAPVVMPNASATWEVRHASAGTRSIAGAGSEVRHCS
ncbi:hypothetical protein ACXR8F_21390 [Terrabacter sp. AAH1]